MCVWGGGGVKCKVMFCFEVLFVLSCFTSSRRRRESWLLCSEYNVAVIVLQLFLAVPWIGLQYVTVAFPGYTHLLFNLDEKHYYKPTKLIKEYQTFLGSLIARHIQRQKCWQSLLA